MRHLRAVAVVIAAFFVQTIAFPATGITFLAPDFLLAATAAVALRRGAGAAIGFGTLAGLLQDLFSGGLLGLNGFSKPLVAFAVARIREDLRLDIPAGTLLLLALAAVGDGVILLALGEIAATGVAPAGRLAALAPGIPLTMASGFLFARFLRQPVPE